MSLTHKITREFNPRVLLARVTYENKPRESATRANHENNPGDPGDPGNLARSYNNAKPVVLIFASKYKFWLIIWLRCGQDPTNI